MLRCPSIVVLVVAVALGLFSGAVSASDSILVATWNLWNLGASSDVTDRAGVISQFDIVALQEIEAIDGLNHLLAEVEDVSGEDWDFVVSTRVGEGNAAEYYAFLYRTDRVAYVECTAGVYPEPTPKDFSREPFFASFRAGDFDFTLITVHITWGLLASLRTAECRRLADVWTYVQDLDPDENDLILMGDFNRDKPTHSAFSELVALGLEPLVTAAGTRTTFGVTASGGYWYDHIWIDPVFTTATEFTGYAGTGTPMLNAVGDGCPDSLRGVSDHCPVWVQFSTLADDDPV